MIEKNPFRFYLPPSPKVLIIGSFPCFNGRDYGDFFYSGSGKNHFWQLLSDTFGMPVSTRKEKEKLCQKNQIALTDIAYKIERKKGNCSDSNLSIIEFNKKGIDTCLKAGVKTIFFTSRFVQKHFLKLYPDLDLAMEVLLSPSPAANMHIGGLQEYRELFSKKLVTSAYAYRLMKYKKMLS